jgi:PLP dependent protein
MADPTAPTGDATTDAAALLAAMRARIDAATAAAGRPAGSVRLVGASKGIPAATIGRFVDAGLVDLGENRAHELRDKAADPACAGARWHWIGQLQRNKVPQLAPLVALWHSVDRAELGAAIARHAPGATVLVQVALAPEATKGGCPPGGVAALVDALRGDGLAVDGLMAIPPQEGDARRWFAQLATLADRLGLAELSMGMSHDLDAAIAEGATIVRVGRALFGPRPPAVGDPRPGPDDVRR